MDYNKIYYSIITNAKNRIITDGYYEKHHIIPRSLGGDNSKENIVGLTAREHYICHLLLTKMYIENTTEWYKMIKAFGMMLWCRGSDQERFITNRDYERYKIYFSKSMSISQSKENNNQYGTIWINNKALKENKKLPKFEEIPDGWDKGRIINWDKYNKKETLKANKQKERIDKWRKIMYYYRDNDISMRDLSKKFEIGINANVNFEKYFPEEYKDIVSKKPMNSYKGKGRY
jgi:hypothetical protein